MKIVKLKFVLFSISWSKDTFITVLFIPTVLERPAKIKPGERVLKHFIPRLRNITAGSSVALITEINIHQQ